MGIQSTSASGPTVMSMYGRAGPQGNPPDTGAGMGRMLTNTELAARTRYAAPQANDNLKPRLGSDGRTAEEYPKWYNQEAPPPVKYGVPSAQKERLVTRELVREAAGEALQREDGGAPAVIRTDPITDEEVQYVQTMREQGELADFDRYVSTLIDPRQPGQLKFLMSLYPEFVNRQLSQVKVDHEYAIRSQLIDQYGVNSFDDLHFLYLRDQGRITGPNLVTEEAVDASYVPSYLSPWAKWGGARKDQGGVRAPFASAKFGAQPRRGDMSRWEIPDGPGKPLSLGRNQALLAKGLYTNNPGNTASADGRAPF